jgi:replicative DNA helicase
MTAADLESHCLSSLMKSASDAYAAAAAGLTARHFTEPKLARLFTAIMHAAADAKDTSLSVVVGYMGQGEALNFSDLMAIDNLQPTSAARPKLVKSVLGALKKRTLAESMSLASNAAKSNAAASYEDVWEQVAPYIEAAQNTATDSTTRTITDFADDVIRKVRNPDARKIVPTGFERWDRDATPLRAGEMITLAARPGVGKTALAVQVAAHVARNVGPVAFFSLEMSGEELVDRVAKIEGGRSVLFGPNNYISAVEQVGKLKALHVYDNADRHSIASIEARSRLLATMPQGLSLVVVDYLQLVEPADRRAPREQQVAEMSRRLKQLAGSIKCPVLVVAQLNRESEKDERKPRLSDLRESGAIEQDSDRVWFIWRDPATMAKGLEDAATIEVVLIQAKCRGGPPDQGTKMQFNRPIFSFQQTAI